MVFFFSRLLARRAQLFALKAELHSQNHSSSPHFLENEQNTAIISKNNRNAIESINSSQKTKKRDVIKNALPAEEEESVREGEDEMTSFSISFPSLLWVVEDFFQVKPDHFLRIAI